MSGSIGFDEMGEIVSTLQDMEGVNKVENTACPKKSVPKIKKKEAFFLKSYCKGMKAIVC